MENNSINKKLKDIEIENVESSRLEEIEKRLKYLERRFDNLIMTLKLEFYEG